MAEAVLVNGFENGGGDLQISMSANGRSCLLQLWSTCSTSVVNASEIYLLFFLFILSERLCIECAHCSFGCIELPGVGFLDWTTWFLITIWLTLLII